MIITVSREFGSGGREIGKRLADELGLDYYDRELVAEIANNADLDEDYVDRILEQGGYKNHVFSFGRSFPLLASTPLPVTDVLVAQQTVIKAIGQKGNCVIVGRCADVILRNISPFRIFVYADEASKIARCRQRAGTDETITDKQMVKRFKEIDGGRAKLHDLLGNIPWGDRRGYELMLNTTGADIKTIVPPLAEMIQLRLSQKR